MRHPRPRRSSPAGKSSSDIKIRREMRATRAKTWWFWEGDGKGSGGCLLDTPLFAASPEGGHGRTVLPGIVTTAKRHDLDIQTYLTWMFERRGTARDPYGLDPPDLTPAAYKKLLAK